MLEENRRGQDRGFFCSRRGWVGWDLRTKSGAHDPEPPSSILALGVNPVPLLVIFRNRGALEFPHIFKMPNQREAMSDVTRR